MEDTLREFEAEETKQFNVLILVLMEDTLREEEIEKGKITSRLNPCFNGRYSQSFIYFVLLN